MKNSTLVHTQVTVGIVRLLKRIRSQLEEEEKKKKRKRTRITKREVCTELLKRCLIKKVV